jgi:hypothetical protein
MDSGGAGGLGGFALFGFVFVFVFGFGGAGRTGSAALGGSAWTPAIN